MSKTQKALTLTIALFVFTANLMAQKSKSAARDYFPLRVGDSWKYRSLNEDSESTVKVVSAEQQADGTTLYLLEKSAGVKIDDWYSKTDGWVLMHREAYPEQEGLDVKYQPAIQYLKNPLVAGAKWRWKGKNIAQTDTSESDEVVGTEMIKVPAGKFQTMKVVSQIDEGSALKIRTSWYADGVGLVKTMTEAGQLKYGFELVEYSFKKSGSKR
jgi:hypothetical protein